MMKTSTSAATNRVEVAVGKFADEWDTLSVDLKTKFGPNHEQIWQKAVEEYFSNRLKERYLKPIQLLQESVPKNKGEGFSIVTIQCSLIEFLESTTQGLIYKVPSGAVKKRRIRKSPENYYYSIDMFKDFLTRTQFAFTEAQSKEFYDDVRCGVLHEAKTKHAWRILADSDNGNILGQEGNTKVLYRNDFQEGFKEFIKWYELELPKNEALQRAFVRKMDSHFSIV